MAQSIFRRRNKTLGRFWSVSTSVKTGFTARGRKGQEDDDQPAVTFTPPASGSPLHYTTSLPQVRIGGLPAKVVFSGLAPGLTGVWQVNVVIPDQAPAGKVPVSVSYEGYDLRSVDITVE